MGSCISKEKVNLDVATSGKESKDKEEVDIKTAPKPGADSKLSDELDLSNKVNFIAPPETGNETERLQLLRALNILDTEREDRFSSITSLMCTVFQVPIAAVSLVDSERQWFKAAEGLGDACETSREVSFCGHTILPTTPQIMIVEDALEDVRFSGNPLVAGPPHIRFYAGAPLVSSANGYRYGSLCIIDLKPHRDFSTDLYNILAQFAELTVREIEKDKLSLLQKMVKEQRNLNLSGTGSPLDSLRSSNINSDTPGTVEWGLTRAADCFLEGVMLLDVASPEWKIIYTNSAWSTVIGVPRDEATTQGFWDLFSGPGLGADACTDSIKSLESFSITVSLQSIYRQSLKAVTIDLRPINSAQLGPSTVGVPVPFNSTATGDAQTGINSHSIDTINSISSDSKETLPSHLFYFGIVHSDGMKSMSGGGAPSSAELANTTTSDGDRHPSDGRPNVLLSKAMATAFVDVRLGPLIGRGAYGRVYRGSWNGNTVAVKVMESNDPSIAAQSAGGHGSNNKSIFEAVLSSSLSHPNIVHTYQYAVRPVTKSRAAVPNSLAANIPSNTKNTNTSDVDFHSRHSSEVWIISEYCNRGPLLTAIERGAFLTQPSAQYGQPNLIAVLQTLQEVAAAMHYLHSQDIIHGDLTGGNILLTASDKDSRGFTAKVVDFGLSRVCVEDGFLKTKTLGCAEYMPPELITKGILTKAGDVYSFGVILWEMYVGRRAWEGLQPGAVLKKVASHEMLEFPPQTPHRLKLLGEKCMGSDMLERPSFREVLSEVNAILGDTMNILQQFLHATSGQQNGFAAPANDAKK